MHKSELKKEGEGRIFFSKKVREREESPLSRHEESHLNTHVSSGGGRESDSNKQGIQFSNKIRGKKSIPCFSTAFPSSLRSIMQRHAGRRVLTLDL